MMRRVTGRVLMLALLLLCALSLTAAACAEVDQGRTCSLTVYYSELDGELIAQAPRMHLELYRVAEVEQAGNQLRYTLTSEFAGSGADLSGLSAATLEKETAQALQDYAVARGLHPVTEATSGSSGEVRFASLRVGLYLVKASPVDADVLSAPILVSLPTLLADGTLDYVPTAKPKLETIHGALLIEKVNASGQMLSGAAFLLERETNGTFVTFAARLTSNDQGQVAVENLPLGTYRLTELEAPAGYQLDTTPRVFSVNAAGSVSLGAYGYTAQEGAVTQRIVNYPIPTPSPTPVPTPGPGEDLVNIRMTKRWADEEDLDGIRPTEITIHLQRRKVGSTYFTTIFTTQVTGDGVRWRYSFQRLPAHADDGTAYEYRIREEEVPGYIAQYSDETYTVTNVHQPVNSPTPTPEPTPEVTPEPTPTPTPLPEITATPLPRRPDGAVLIDGEWVFIDENGVPLGLIPQTGDEDDLAALLIGAGVLLTLGVGLLIWALRRRKHAHA